MNVVAIVQARFASTRLPGKVLADLAGEPMLARQIERIRRAKRLDQVMIATTTGADDERIVALATRIGCPVHRGSETDVLGRYLEAARRSAADVIVRITADCPLIEPQLIDAVVTRLVDCGADYASNVVERTFPRGLDVEALTLDTLVRIEAAATSSSAREHVTTYLRWECPEQFSIASVTDDEDNSDLRWTVDSPEDLAYVRQLYERFRLADEPIGYRELIARARAAGLVRYDAIRVVA